MASWDRRTTKQLAAQHEAAVRAQVMDAVAPFSPWWRERLQALGRTATEVATPDGLESLPAAGERDLCPDGDPSGAAALVLQARESGWALHARGPQLRKALGRRLTAPGSYAAIVEADTRATSFLWAGLALRFPLASTRSDLDVVARAGARLWQVLGLSRADVVVSALPAAASAPAQALSYGALGAGAPLLAPGADLADVVEALRLVPATVLALPAQDAARWVDDLDEAGVPLDALSTLLLVGAPDDDERAAARDALDQAGVPVSCAVLAVHVPDGHRLAWGECREGGAGIGLHTYPDLELLQVVDPETGERVSGEVRAPSELVLSQLGMRGSALLRWRTGDLVDGIEQTACEGCGRTVPRVLGTRRRALVPVLDLVGGTRAVDLRAVSAALLGRPDVGDWRVVVGRSARDGADQLIVHVTPARGGDPTAVALAVVEDVLATSGLVPTQVVVDPGGALPAGRGRHGRRVLVRR